MAKKPQTTLTRREFLKVAGALGVVAAAGSIPLGIFTACPAKAPNLGKLPEIKYQFSDSAGNRTISQFVQAQLSQNLGVNITLEPMESAAYQNLVNSENQHSAFWGWGADYPDPENFLEPNFHTGAGNNHWLYSNAEFDALMDKALVELDNTKRLKYLTDAHEIMVNDVPGAFIYNRERFYLVNSSLKPTLKPTGMDGQIMGDRFFREVSMPNNTLRVNLSGEPNTLDPNPASWASSLSCIYQLFDGLLGFNQDLSIKAVVAAEMPTTANGGISADGMTYTFKLKNNVTWSDGKKVTAGDFAYSIKRFFDPATASEYASVYYAIAGAEAYNGGTGSADAVGVRAVDDTTLEIKLARPQPTFLSLMAMWPVYPVPKSVIDAKGAQWTEAGNLVGNGPFILTEWAHQDHMTFKQNPNYWGTKPSLTEMRFVMVTDIQASLAAYKNNELDMTAVPPGTEKATMADAAVSPQIVRSADLNTFGMQFNVTKAPFDNKKVRQAFSCAIDRVAFVDQVRSGVGHATTSWVPPGMPGYDANLGKEWGFNAAKAKQLLKDSGYTV